jgi:hypothetical protein
MVWREKSTEIRTKSVEIAATPEIKRRPPIQAVTPGQAG